MTTSAYGRSLSCSSHRSMPVGKRQLEISVRIEEAWSQCSDLYLEWHTSSTSRSYGRLENEILFCLLGGFGITYELCMSAARVVSAMRPFSDIWSDDLLLTNLKATLGSRSFEPRCRDGSLRRYRFPNRKAKLIVEARRWLLRHSPISRVLDAHENSRSRRAFLCRCPGIGPKTASWILRNTGRANDVAILDVHVVAAMQSAGRIGNVRLPQDYEHAEAAFLEWCRELRAPASAFDLFVWDWQRGSLMKE